MGIYTKQAYSEVNTFINLLGVDYINKIPIKVRNFFKSEKDNNYIVSIDPSIPIEQQNLKEETLAIIAFLNLKYWCEDENEIDRLKKVYKKNEKLYQENLTTKYNVDNMFKNKQKNYDVSSQTSMVEYKENNSILKKIINRIKAIFITKK